MPVTEIRHQLHNKLEAIVRNKVLTGEAKLVIV